MTTCAKGLLNGPCGGMEEGRCEADRDIDCAWHLIYERLKRQNRPGVFARIVPAKNWGKLRKPGRHKIVRSGSLICRDSFMSRLSEALAAGRFVITAEVAPPKGADAGEALARAVAMPSAVSAVNVTDNQGANMRMAPLALAVLLLRRGVEPILQLTCRDRNRMALQSDLLGAAALGVENLLLLSGDHARFGDHPQAKSVFDLDSVQAAAGGRLSAAGARSGRPATERGAAIFCRGGS